MPKLTILSTRKIHLDIFRNSTSKSFKYGHRHAHRVAPGRPGGTNTIIYCEHQYIYNSKKIFNISDAGHTGCIAKLFIIKYHSTRIVIYSIMWRNFHFVTITCCASIVTQLILGQSSSCSHFVPLNRSQQCIRLYLDICIRIHIT